MRNIRVSTNAQGISTDYPLMSAIADVANDNESMGFMNLPLHEEIAMALYELWLARANNPRKEAHA